MQVDQGVMSIVKELNITRTMLVDALVSRCMQLVEEASEREQRIEGLLKELEALKAGNAST